MDEMPYFLSKANTLDLVDAEELMRELTVRGIKCEVPGCTSQAAGILTSRISIFTCKPHGDACVMSVTALRSIEAAVVTVLKSHMAQASSAAYEDNEGEVTFSFDGTTLMLAMARQLAEATEIDQPPTPPMVLPALPPVVQSVVRPVLASLETSNGAPEMPDFFVI